MGSPAAGRVALAAVRPRERRERLGGEPYEVALAGVTVKAGDAGEALKVAGDLLEAVAFSRSGECAGADDAVVITCDGEVDEALTELAREGLRPVRLGEWVRPRPSLSGWRGTRPLGYSRLSSLPGSSTSGVGAARMGFGLPDCVAALFCEILIVSRSARKR